MWVRPTMMPNSLYISGKGVSIQPSFVIVPVARKSRVMAGREGDIVLDHGISGQNADQRHQADRQHKEQRKQDLAGQYQQPDHVLQHPAGGCRLQWPHRTKSRGGPLCHRGVPDTAARTPAHRAHDQTGASEYPSDALRLGAVQVWKWRSSVSDPLLIDVRLQKLRGGTIRVNT